jgi:hypothetical protein
MVDSSLVNSARPCRTFTYAQLPKNNSTIPYKYIIAEFDGRASCNRSRLTSANVIRQSGAYNSFSIEHYFRWPPTDRSGRMEVHGMMERKPIHYRRFKVHQTLQVANSQLGSTLIRGKSIYAVPTLKSAFSANKSGFLDHTHRDWVSHMRRHYVRYKMTMILKSTYRRFSCDPGSYSVWHIMAHYGTYSRGPYSSAARRWPGQG